MNLLAALLIALGSPSPDESPYVAGVYRLPIENSAFRVESGRVLLRELGCAHCHVPEHAVLPAPRRAPLLDGLRHRMNADFLRDWLRAPEELAGKTGTVMPHIDFGDDPEAVIDALTHFLLADDGTPPPKQQRADTDAIARGDILYHTAGCVACHQPMREPKMPTDDMDDIFDDGPVIESDLTMHVWPVDFPDLDRKTNLAALTAFLLDPLATRPDGRMPGMHLSEAEARDIAAYLLREQTQELAINFAADPEKALEGRRLFSELRCVACHAHEGTNPPVPSPSWETIAASDDWGCGGPANYSISDPRLDQAIRLARFEPIPSPTLREELAALNCYACHERDALGGIEPYRARYFTAAIDADLGDEGRLPPTLTGVGAKLTEEGLRGILLKGESVRPYMATRMPDFGATNVAHLIPMFLEEDNNPDAPAIDVSGLEHHHRNMYGRQLMGTDGLGCVSCHVVNGHRSLGIPAIDLALAPRRLQPSWFKQYLLDPASLRPGTRMPAFFPEGKSTFPDLWNGDANKQIEALWIYLREIDQTRLPVGMEDDTNYELVPEDRPILLRTFMEGIGTQAIAVGFPQGVHVAFDARFPRFALAWTGKFIDAESTWADRFSPFAKPLGAPLPLFPEGPPVVHLESDNAPWPAEYPLRFSGYTLSPFGIPTFEYRTLDGAEIQDTVWPERNKVLRRRVEIGPHAEQLYLMLVRGDNFSHGKRFLSINGITPIMMSGEAALRFTGDTAEIVAAIPPSDLVTCLEWDLTW